jgi:ATP-binding cassette subfamily B protein
VLKDVSLTVQPGETIAILGKTGSGKSSLMHLLVRLYEPTSGKILFDGVEAGSISKRWLRDRVSIVLQEPFLFSKTLKENLMVAWRRMRATTSTNAATSLISPKLSDSCGSTTATSLRGGRTFNREPRSPRSATASWS